MTSLTAELSAIAGRAFAAEGLASALARSAPRTVPTWRSSSAMARWRQRKQAKANPRAIAEKIAARLKADPLFAKVEIAGPGFINLDLADDALCARAAIMERRRAARRAQRQGQYARHRFRRPQCRQAHACGPSELIHHRRLPAAALPRQWLAGDQRRASGRLGPADGPADFRRSESQASRRSISIANFTGPYPEESPVTMDDLEELYPAASAACKADPARLEAARRATVELQEGRPGYRALWRHFVKVSERGLEREFGSLGVHFDLWKGESSVDALIAPMIDDLKRAGWRA